MVSRHQRTPILHQYVKHGGVIYFAGLVASDLTQPMAGQTEHVLAQLGDLLTKAGSDKSKVLTATIYITDMALKPEMNAVWTAWFGDHLPTRATIGVADLGPNVLIEVVFSAAE